MAETKKFVDLHGLDVFWDGAKKYIDAADEVVTSHADGLNTAMDTRVKALEGIDHEAYKAADATLKEDLLAKIAENAAADALLQTAVATNTGDIKSIQDELNSLSGGAGSIATQIDNAIAKLDLPNTYEAKGEAAKAETAAKTYADGLAANYDAAGAADTALAAAKTYADGLAANYDAAGAADTALAAAKTYADGLAANYDAAGAASAAETAAKTYADGLNTAMNTRVEELEAIDHEQLAADAAAAAVATVLDGAPESFDTLKEVAAWIADSESAADAADLVTRVSALEAIDHNAYVDADATVLASAKTYADGLASNYDAAGAADTALAAAKTYADGLAANYDAAGAAATALTDAKAYADGLATNYDAAGAAGAASAAAKKYTDDTIAAFEFASDDDINALFA